MSEREFDVVVIGMGPGAEHVAEELARAGVPVAAVEEHLVGGECPYWGCIPSKMMIRAANLLTEGRRIPAWPAPSVISPSWAPVAKRIRDEATDNWDDKVAADRYTDLGGALIRGHGQDHARPARSPSATTCCGPGEASSSASGPRPPSRPIDGLAQTPYWTNHEAIETEDVPRSLLILGGGTVGCRAGQVFARFGSSVTVIEAMATLLPMEEPESGELHREGLRAEDITVSTGTRPNRSATTAAQFTVSLAGGRQLRGERLLVATGRKTDLAAPWRRRYRAGRGGPRSSRSTTGCRPLPACGRSAT